MIEIRIDLRRSEPAWQQILEGVLDRLADGSLAPGDKLPSVRGMAQSVRVNPNTVARAYRELEVLGVVEPRPGRGVFVTERGPGIARRSRGKAVRAQLHEAVGDAVEAGLDAEAIRKVIERALGRLPAPREEER